MSRPLRPCERRPSRNMLRALRHAVALEKGAQGEPWVALPTERRAPSRYGRACARRGLAEEYRVTPDGTLYFRITPAGRDVLVVAR
ncbi:hypothetical protein [Actinomycetospora termitidis]|uniref:Uncharacterized protein n=1 Tax=Actinomycetospora termitidis TaxID=3053470 RepID=A0ABT7MFL8_9PSEU|nr:hypothetical protein [Actinomycetospora sp. Odt1-22]MDL5159465.1 hypothetical protein [Actinomycetospora sp. Odt1-22]